MINRELVALQQGADLEIPVLQAMRSRVTPSAPPFTTVMVSKPYLHVPQLDKINLPVKHVYRYEGSLNNPN